MVFLMIISAIVMLDFSIGFFIGSVMATGGGSDTYREMEDLEQEEYLRTWYAQHSQRKGRNRRN